MHEEVTASTRVWRRVFLGVETVVAVGGLVLLVGEVFQLNQRFGAPEILWRVLGLSVTTACLFLLLVAPFFLRALRGIALTGWILAVSMILLGMLLPA